MKLNSFATIGKKLYVVGPVVDGVATVRTSKGKEEKVKVSELTLLDAVQSELVVKTFCEKGLEIPFFAPVVSVVPPVEEVVETLPAPPAEIALPPVAEKQIEVVEVAPTIPRSPRLVAPAKLPTFAEISKRFGCVYQKSASEDFSFTAWEAIQGKNPLQPRHISGYAGLGKTHFVENVFVPFLENFGFGLVTVPIACTASQLTKLLVDAPEKAIFWIDEVHAIKCANLLKSITETGGQVKDFELPLGNESFTVTVDPRKWLFITASNHALKDSALVGQSGRFQPSPFLPYDEKARKALLVKLGEQYGLGTEESASITLLAKNVRPFARSMKNLVNDIRMQSVIDGTDASDTDALKAALVARSYFPGGWKQHHIDVLKFVNGSPKGRQVQEIAASPLQGRDSKEASEILAEMLQGDLIQTNSQGRKQISAQGVVYLTKLVKASK